jgi:hypothetical protein
MRIPPIGLCNKRPACMADPRCVPPYRPPCHRRTVPRRVEREAVPPNGFHQTGCVIIGPHAWRNRDAFRPTGHRVIVGRYRVGWNAKRFHRSGPPNGSCHNRPACVADPRCVPPYRSPSAGLEFDHDPQAGPVILQPDGHPVQRHHGGDQTHAQAVARRGAALLQTEEPLKDLLTRRFGYA